MKQLLLRLWQWLGKLLGAEPTPTPGYRRETDGLPAPRDGQAAASPAAAPPVAAAAPPPVTLPPPSPPQLDLHAGEAPRFSRKASLLTKPEGRLYRSLLRAVGGDYTVMAKVRLWDFLWLENEPPDRREYLSRLSCRHVDFLLCESDTLKPLLAIELDDYSHKKPEAQAADRFKDELFAVAGLPLLRLDHPNYPPAQLRAKLTACLVQP